jgi:hypothetical protein
MVRNTSELGMVLLCVFVFYDYDSTDRKKNYTKYKTEVLLFFIIVVGSFFFYLFSVSVDVIVRMIWMPESTVVPVANTKPISISR